MLRWIKTLLFSAATHEERRTEATVVAPVAQLHETPGVAALLALAANAVARQDLAQAEERFQDVIRADAHNVEATLGLAQICIEQDRYAAAETLVSGLISTISGLHQAHYLLGQARQALGKFSAAIAEYDKALQLEPKLAAAYRDACFCHVKLGQLAFAKQILLTGITLNPDFADLHFFRGNLFLEEGNAADALRCFERAMSLSPENAAWHFNHGVALQHLRNDANALESYSKAIQLLPQYADAYNNRGVSYLRLRQPSDALADFERAIEINPDTPGARANRGCALRVLGKANAALSDFELALLRHPEAADIWNHRGMALQDLHQHDVALQSYARAISLKPAYAEAHFNEALCRLQVGDFARGWEKYEWRRRISGAHWPVGTEHGMPWKGEESLQGKSILLHAEQGLGDTIQFCRYAPHLVERGASVYLNVQGPLASLLSQIQKVTLLISGKSVLPVLNYHASLLSLPLAFRTTLDTIPANTPYLRANPEIVKEWAAVLGPKRRFRIGLVWTGNADHGADSQRSIPLSIIRGLLSVDAEFICLQKELRPEDREMLGAGVDIAFLGNNINDFSDTAALIELVDLVVSVDTSVAHLAGAMGKPLWLLLAFNPDFRWLLDRTNSPWYPSATLFRQDKNRDWQTVIDLIKNSLTKKMPTASLN